MIGTEDARHTFEYQNYYIIVPEMYIHNEPLMKTYMEGRIGKQLPEGFSYCSNTNKQWLSVEDLQKLLPSVRYI
jgi:UDP-N-acetylglucosamine 4,6-dehydratase